MSFAPKITADHVAGLSAQDTAGYWWFVSRHAFVRRLLQRAFARGAVRYLDFGCGTGGTLAAVLRDFTPATMLGIDGTPQAVAISNERGLPAQLADVEEPFAVAFTPNAITCLDVLEHLDDPVGALRNLAKIADVDSELLVTVPAMPSLHSNWDDLCGHRRRYTKALIAEHLRAGGFEPTWLRFAFAYAVPPAFVQRRVLRTVQRFEFPPVSRPVNAMLRAAGTVERLLGNPFPFGTSLVAFARRAR